ncbi:MAG: hypothetical protein GY703_04560 [Gammaproteobacteria bacterium]|nr:hypothetical protein [Gammaproteobacteria bacterium]
MKKSSRYSPVIKFFPLAGVLVFSGCSGPQEDVRLSFCKRLIDGQPGFSRGGEWKGSNIEARRLEYARIDVSYGVAGEDAGDSPMEASCFYAYGVAQENSALHGDLSVYATVPYKMIINGRTLSDRELDRAINRATLNQGKELVDSVRQGVEETKKNIRKELTQ